MLSLKKQIVFLVFLVLCFMDKLVKNGTFWNVNIPLYMFEEALHVYPLTFI